MNHDTPLPEVAHYLSAPTAQLLMYQTPYLQNVILTAAKWIIIVFENEGDLNPITLQESLHAFVVSTLNLYGVNPNE